MIKSSKELFEHKEEYEEMFSALKNVRRPPFIDKAILGDKDDTKTVN